MSNPSEQVTAEVLRSWGVPDPGESKKSRGRIVVVGGSRRTPGAVTLAGEAALRVGAGRLGLLVPASIESQLGIAIPEAAVMALPGDSDDPIPPSIGEELRAADAVLVGPGFDDPGETRATLLAVAAWEPACLVLDAFGLGVLPEVERDTLPDLLVLNPNREEASLLLDRELDADDALSDLREIAERYRAVVNCYGDVVAPGGSSWSIHGGGAGLGTSGSGDVLAGAIAGFAARGIEPGRAAVWGSWVHARAGDRLTARTGIGFLARELAAELTPALAEVTG
ncbi:NAD(P)H-hydrate dehydratase [Microbacterium sp. Root180]|uniref:ADP-dependent NAD(P)H-hydrate dehydratase n=1 Tax=Microbacterium sp. Root180 TaxID=1736483 RepID=UPI0006FEEC0C|nr:ADP/ATP-dependent (S)-NAD(P)H-hydrate dehydratase [Microbacterium sp. Root180]KRB38634.1 sugar kinase [Microbacterium sp. Root180]